MAEQNTFPLNMATLYITALHRMATDTHRKLQSMRYGVTTGGDSAPVRYSSATFDWVMPENGFHILVTKLFGVEGIGTVKSFKFEQNVDPIVDCLKILTVDGHIIDVDTTILPLKDEEFSVWYSVLEETIIELLALTVGKYKDEAELGSILDRFRSRYTGSEMEEPVAEILDGLRVRARKAQATAEMLERQDASLQLPSAAMLNLWSRRSGGE